MNSIVPNIQELFDAYLRQIHHKYCEKCAIINCNTRYSPIYRGLALEALLFDDYISFTDYLRLGEFINIFCMY